MNWSEWLTNKVFTPKKKGELSLVELCAINWTECYSPLQTVFRICLTYSTYSAAHRTWPSDAHQESSFNISDAPWMNDHLKSLILKRQKAFHDAGTESLLYKFCRNAVNRKRKSYKASALNRNLAHMKNPSFGSINIVLISHVICHVTILLKIVNYWPVGGRFKKRNRAITFF